MKHLLLFTALLLGIAADGQELPAIVFNELNTDNPGGPDNSEFVELYGLPGQTLDSLVIVLYEGNTDLSYAAFDLDGYSLDENGFFVIGNAGAANVDYVIANSTISNGQDGIALYYANAADFPTDSAPVTINMIDAAVYSTGDAIDNGLITALGLDVLIPGYTQLDETAQQNFPDFSLSRIPDGGLPFEFAPYVLQEITPGTFNVAQCVALAPLFSDLSNSQTFCDNSTLINVSFIEDSGSYGDTMLYALTDANDLIIDTTSSLNFDLTSFPVGVYNIYGISYNGALDANTIAVGSSVNNLQATSCISVSDNFLTISIVACGGCIGGEIFSDTGDGMVACLSDVSEINLSNNSTSEDDNYLYIITDFGNTIVDTFSVDFDFNSLPVGNYNIYGLSYVGSLDQNSIAIGQNISSIVSDVCADLSSNSISITINDCVDLLPCEKIFISEYLEGNNGTKALELFNPTLTDIDLNGYSILQYANGSQIATDTLILSGMLGPLSTLVIANPGTGNGNGQADPDVVDIADIVDVIANYSGNDALELRHNDTVIDVIGIAGDDPGNQQGWAAGDGTTRNFDLVRKWGIQHGVDVWAVSSLQWDVYANDDFSHLGNHLFDACSDQIIAGFIGTGVSVNENIGTITITVQCQNVQDVASLDVQITGGSSELADYISTLPATLTFNSTTSLLTISIDIVNDTEAEFSEDLVLTLQSETDVYWTNQIFTITIEANDPNCDGGFIQNAAGNQPVVQCSDLPNNPIELTINTNFTAANYLFIVTDINDLIIDTTSVLPIDLDLQPAGTYRIWGLSYTGSLNPLTLQINQPADEIAADTCSSLSNNFITVFRDACVIVGCDAGEVFTEDGQIFQTACIGAIETNILPQNNGQSIDDSYTYFLTDANDIIIQELDASWTCNSAAEGIYHIYGVSYVGNFDSATIAAGSPISGVLSDNCAELTSNFIEVVLVACDGPAPCTEIFFSEILEDSQSNKAIEIYNPSPFAIDLAGYTINMYSNGSTVPTEVLNCSGTIAAYDVYVIVSSGNGQNPTDQIILDQADTLHAVSTFSGNDAIELSFNGNSLDVLGIIGDDPGQFGWQFGNSSTSNQALVRRPEVTMPNSDWNIVSGQWISYDPTDYSHLGAHAAADCGNAEIATLGFTTAAQLVTENTALVTVSIDYNNPGSDFIITVDAAGTAINGNDYTAIFPLELTIPVGSGTLSFDISIFGDGLLEGDETIDLSISTSTNILYSNQNTIITIQDFVGIAKNELNQIKVYPNPCADQLQVSSEEKIKSIRICDMSGRVVLNKNYGDVNSIKLDLASLSAGQYVVEIKTLNTVSRNTLSVIK